MEQPVLRTRKQSAESSTHTYHYNREDRLSRAGKEFPWLDRPGRSRPSGRAIRLIIIDSLLVIAIFSLYNTFWREPGPVAEADGYRLQLVSPADGELALTIAAEESAAATGGVLEVRLEGISAAESGAQSENADNRLLDAAPVPGGPEVTIPLPIAAGQLSDVTVLVALPTGTQVRLRQR